MLRKILIANRGEIAVRVAQACRDAGLSSVAVYADQDWNALHVRAADEAFALPGTTPGTTYLDIGALLAAAQRAGADAVHPGYGFLSENPAFAEAVLAAGLVWIGPSPDVIRRLGDKVTARALAAEAGVPVVPGTSGPVADADEVVAFAAAHGLPIAIKAVHGGGGRGMRVVREGESIREAYAGAVRESVAAFGRGECFVERYLDNPRHVEVQVAADASGAVVVVGTRDCSLQRRHQKLVEEAPAPFLSADQDELLERSAVALFRAAGYVGVGTVEFLLAPSGDLFFLEVNTRLQVEHPVTEVTSGVDLVREQFRIADGLPLSIDGRPEPRGHAFEFRINAEDPGRGYLPSPGRISAVTFPRGPGVRVDSGVDSGSVIPEAFDSLFAKVVVYGRDRTEAAERARRALDEMSVSGVATTLPFHRSVLRDEAFVGVAPFRVHTRWIETERTLRDEPQDEFSDLEPDPGRVSFPIEVDGRRTIVTVPRTLLAGLPAGAEPQAAGDRPPARDANGEVRAPLRSTVVKWLRAEGEPVEVGEAVVVIEAMKMQTALTAPVAGVLTGSTARPGDEVERGTVLAVVREA